MKRIFLTTLAIWLCFWSVTLATPRVPDQLRFADMRLKLDKDAVAGVQRKVDDLVRSPRHYEEFVGRCQLYFPLIEEAFRASQLPEDFKFLALQESALLADRISKSGAVGYWQFKEVSGVESGLRIDRRIDERKHILASSQAAARYLHKQQLVFKNWVYALLAYNLGTTGANSIINRRYIGTDRMELDRHTHQYIIHFLAHKIAFEEGLSRASTPALTLWLYADAKGKSLQEIADLSGLEYEQLRRHNHWLHVREVPTDASFPVLIPVQKGQESALLARLNVRPAGMPTKEEGVLAFEEDLKVIEEETDEYALEALDSARIFQNPKDYPKITSDEVRQIGGRGIRMVTANGLPAIIAGEKEDLTRLCADLGISKSKFLKINDLNAFDDLRPGRIYYLKKKPKKAVPAQHAAQRGETLWDVSQRYGVRLASLIKYNRMRKGEDPQPGRILWLNATRPQDQAIEFRPLAPDSPVSTPVTTNPPAATDPGSAPATGQPADNKEVIEVPVNTPIGLAEGTHMVKKGETVFTIVRQYGITLLDLRELNPNLRADMQVSEGQILRVKPEGNAPQPANPPVGQQIGQQPGITPNPGTGITPNPGITPQPGITPNPGITPQPGAVSQPPAAEQPRTTYARPNGDQVYQVRKGDGLRRIATSFGTTVDELRRLNSLPSDAIREGQELVIRPANGTLPALPATPAPAKPASAAGTLLPVPANGFHLAKAGETVESIAALYGFDPKVLAATNAVPVNKSFAAGDQLLVMGIPVTASSPATSPAGTPAAPISAPVTPPVSTPVATPATGTPVVGVPATGVPATGMPATGTPNVGGTTLNMPSNPKPAAREAKYHTIKKGETLGKIAAKYKVTPQQIRNWNNFKGDKIQAGDKIVIGYTGPPVTASTNPIAETQPLGAANTQKKFHTVKKGDTLFSIARKYSLTVNELKILNNMRGEETIRTGQELRVR